jgi:hypothetical protein
VALTHKAQPILHPSVAQALHDFVPAGLADREAFCLRLQDIYGASTASEILSAMLTNQFRCYWLNPLQPPPKTQAFGGEPVDSLAGVYRVPVDHPITRHSAAVGWPNLYTKSV